MLHTTASSIIVRNSAALSLASIAGAQFESSAEALIVELLSALHCADSMQRRWGGVVACSAALTVLGDANAALLVSQLLLIAA
jgi:hypothetical protein